MTTRQDERREQERLVRNLVRLGIAPKTAAAVAEDPEAIERIARAAEAGTHAVKSAVAALKAGEPGDAEIVALDTEDDAVWHNAPAWARQLNQRIRQLEDGAEHLSATKAAAGRDAFGRRAGGAAAKGDDKVVHLDGSTSRRAN